MNLQHYKVLKLTFTSVHCELWFNWTGHEVEFCSSLTPWMDLQGAILRARLMTICLQHVLSVSIAEGSRKPQEGGERVVQGPGCVFAFS